MLVGELLGEGLELPERRSAPYSLGTGRPVLTVLLRRGRMVLLRGDEGVAIIEGRNITSYGVGLNIDTNLRWFDRIVACGLEGKKMTSIVQCLKETERIKLHPNPTHVANIWAGEFARGLWGHQAVLRIVDSQERYEILEGLGDERLTKEGTTSWKGTAT